MKLHSVKFFAAIILFAGASIIRAQNSATATEKKIRIVLVGDSTMNDQGGWGWGFKQFLAPDAECINTAMNGRSTMSFMQEGRWTNALALHGDYYFIQFGHNNQPGHPGRETDMPTFVSQMKQYVEDAKAIGAKPVLVTPLCRRSWDKDAPEKIKSSLAPYAVEVRKIAAEKNVPLIELHDRSKEYYEKVGQAETEKWSPVKTVDGTNSVDTTHLAGNGRVLMARLVVDELRKAVPELAPHLLAEPNPAAAKEKTAGNKKADANKD
jgi:pectinesterase